MRQRQRRRMSRDQRESDGFVQVPIQGRQMPHADWDHFGGHRRYRRRWLRSRANVPFGRSTYYPFQMTGEHRFEASRMVLFPGLLLLANGTIARAAEARSMFRKSTVTTMSAALILLANA